MQIFQKILMLLLIPALCWSKTDSSIYQRSVVIKNDLPFAIYPVLQVPDNNCSDGSTKVNRIVVKSGLQQGQSVKINLPDKCWYNAGRLYLFNADISKYEQLINETERTSQGGGGNKNGSLPLCSSADPSSQTNSDPGCYSGTAQASYPLDSPSQLVEYTFDADDPKTGNPSKDPDSGVPMTDIDISYVDQAYLPVAIAVDDNGASGYLGTVMPYQDFKAKSENFIKAGWSQFAAFSQSNWQNNLFHTLVKDRIPNLPAGYNLFQLIITKATSELYKSTPSEAKKSEKSPACSAWPQCSSLSGDCCPVRGTWLACCGVSPDTSANYIIDNTVMKDGKMTNPAFDEITRRFKLWVDGSKDPCSDLDKITTWPSTAGSFDKKSFCEMFGKTAKFVWNTFEPQGNSCGPDVDKDHCIIKTILGYNSKVLSGALPQSVQGLLRSVPYVPEGTGPQYQIDKWLLFWAPFDSIFSLNPFTHFIHKDINAVAYSFSIDDKYGNFRTKGSAFIVNAGGDSALINKSAFDPYEQYFVSWAENWDHADICGNTVDINALPGNSRLSFWQNGTKNDHCDIKLFAKSGNYVTFRITEKTWQVTDTYTGIPGFTVHGLANDVDYCKANSSKALSDICSRSNLSAVTQGDIAYLNVSQGERPNVYLNIPPSGETPSNGGDKGICTGRAGQDGNPVPCCNPSLNQICPGQIACPACGTDNCECPQPKS